jgi:hypothetical protein
MKKGHPSVSENLKPLIREILKPFPYVLLYHTGTHTYWLREHWKYIYPETQAKRVLLGPNKISKKGIQYLNEI